MKTRPRRRGRPALLESDQLKIRLDLNDGGAYAEAGKILKAQLDAESRIVDISVSEYVIRILLSMGQIERVARGRASLSTVPASLPAEPRSPEPAPGEVTPLDLAVAAAGGTD